MIKHKEPQIFIFNNDEIANELDKSYIIGRGNTGIIKKVNFDHIKSDKVYVNLDYDHVASLHEYKVIVIDNSQELVEINSSEDPNNRHFMFTVEYPNNIFNPTALTLSHIKSVFNSDCLKIIFAETEPEIISYSAVEIKGKNQYLNYSNEGHNFYNIIEATAIRKSGVKIKASDNMFSKQLEKYVAGYNVIFNLPTKYDYKNSKSMPDNNYIPLIFNSNNEVISYIGYDNSTGYELVLPLCNNKASLIIELFENIFPQFLPELFPESDKFSWVEKDIYELPEIKKLNAKKQELQNDFNEKIKEIENAITSKKQEYKFLLDLLTGTGNELVIAVKIYMEWLGFTNVILVDDEENGPLREDIQIESDQGLFIIEVKGIGGTSTDSECAQISKHRRRREKERKGQDIIPLYIVNHQRYMNPSQRENPPFTNDQIGYAETDERGLLTTLQLYKLYQYIEAGIFSKKDIMMSLSGYGLISMIPKTIKFVGKVEEYFSKPKASIVNNIDILLEVGDEVLCNKHDIWIKGIICSLQVNDQNVNNVSEGEVGIVLDIEISKGYSIYKRIIE